MIHTYNLEIRWEGSSKESTSSYTSYTRNHSIKSENKPLVLGSSDPHFMGDKSRYNPEELFLSSISSCHMLWYLHLCSDNQIIVTSYIDNPVGHMKTDADGGGSFIKVVLNPTITITGEYMLEIARNLHDDAHRLCFIANSCNFPISCEPQFIKQG